MVDLLLLRDKFLSDCPPENAFWSCSGVVSRNIYELINNIRSLNDSRFRYHVNEDRNKNDFANWIRDVLDDEELALRLQGVYDKDRFVDIIQQRIWAFEDAYK